MEPCPLPHSFCVPPSHPSARSRPSVLGLLAGMTPFLCAGFFSYARESVETIPFTIDLNLSLAMQLFRGLQTASAETTAPLFPAYEIQSTKPCRRRQAGAESPYPVLFLLQAQRAPSLFGDQASQPPSYRAL